MLRIVPMSRADANRVVAAFHRHHKPVIGHRFALGVIDETDTVRGVAIVGRPVARMVDASMVCEVSRVATDGVRNGCSMLLGAAARAARAMGYARIQTYTLPVEGGASLRGAGWVPDLQSAGGSWSRDNRAREAAAPTCVKQRWVKDLQSARAVKLPQVVQKASQQVLLFTSPAAPS